MGIMKKKNLNKKHKKLNDQIFKKLKIKSGKQEQKNRFELMSSKKNILLTLENIMKKMEYRNQAKKEFHYRSTIFTNS